MNKINFRSILVECGKRNCTNSNTICNVVDACWKDKNLDATEYWYNHFKDIIHIMTPDQISIQIGKANSGPKPWKGEIEKVPAKYTKLIGKIVRNTKKSVVTKAVTTAANNATSGNNDNYYNLKTIVTLCGQSGISGYKNVSNMLKRMVADNKVKQENYDWFTTTFNSDDKVNRIITRTLSGDTKWGSQELQDFKDFSNYIPFDNAIKVATDSIKDKLNNRSIIIALTNKGKCDDALSVVSVLTDFDNAGFKKVNFKTIPNLLHMNESQLKDMSKEAIDGTGPFKGEELIKDDILNKL